jgi:3-(methylthio)propanoyl-CoA dehydrogenase
VPYLAPLQDMLFCMQHVADLSGLSNLPGLQDADIDTAEAVLNECAKFSQEVLSPLNMLGDQQPAFLKNGQVTTAPGFKQAFIQFGQCGWQGLSHPVKFGGQGLPKTIACACIEMVNSANMSFALCPLLTDGAIEALLTAAHLDQQVRYLPHMLSGQWTGTMNLTEPQAGSDLAQVRTRAERQSDGSYHLTGTKIYITYGDHDMAENIVHLVLARVVGAPAGVKGLSLFVVPKFLLQPDGSLGARNDVQCVSLEHKLGIKASPTAVLAFGGQTAAVGELVGQENGGLQYMFVMMNAARFAVGMQGIALAQRAYQQARDYAKERVQSRPVDASQLLSVAIVHHPDVKRMLMTMRALTEGCRAMAVFAAAACDRAHHHCDLQVQTQQQARYEFMVPLVKGFCTEMALEVASLGVQVHGGMGFIEETGAAQFYRDAKILTIYEGTTAIQANDLVGRKTVRDQGLVAHQLIFDVMQTEAALQACTSLQAIAMGTHLQRARVGFGRVVDFVLAHHAAQPNMVYAGSVPYLMLAANLLAGWQMARSLLVAQELLLSAPEQELHCHAKIATAHFYAEHILTRVPSLEAAILHGGASACALPTESF